MNAVRTLGPVLGLCVWARRRLRPGLAARFGVAFGNTGERQARAEVTKEALFFAALLELQSSRGMASIALHGMRMARWRQVKYEESSNPWSEPSAK